MVFILIGNDRKYPIRLHQKFFNPDFNQQLILKLLFFCFNVVRFKYNP